ncbi:hypothetical protein PAPYR_11000 [Paratrimastix pyriformis]|uniref:Uncharacterized protein n=1 Tax=Paratrimastix pyriformis TaxID=342808 RepID=A0ABQ8U7B6_9EUKA|nr:hypothetical protein PAPYR_11000 [Paratrimastix pyriformis]
MGTQNSVHHPGSAKNADLEGALNYVRYGTIMDNYIYPGVARSSVTGKTTGQTHGRKSTGKLTALVREGPGGLLQKRLGAIFEIGPGGRSECTVKKLKIRMLPGNPTSPGGAPGPVHSTFWGPTPRVGATGRAKGSRGGSGQPVGPACGFRAPHSPWWGWWTGGVGDPLRQTRPGASDPMHFGAIPGCCELPPWSVKVAIADRTHRKSHSLSFAGVLVSGLSDVKLSFTLASCNPLFISMIFKRSDVRRFRSPHAFDRFRNAGSFIVDHSIPDVFHITL